MQKNTNVVEDALFQIKNLEEALQENAKGILHSTMKEEIKQLVKESLNEQDEDDDEIEDTTIAVDDEDQVNPDETDITIDSEMDDMDDLSDYDDDEEDTIDLTAAPDSEVLKVFRAMGPEDGIIVKKEEGMLNLKDGEKEYMIQLGESDLDDISFREEDDDDDFSFSEDDDDDIVFEITMNEDDDFEKFADEENTDEDEDDDFNIEDFFMSSDDDAISDELEEEGDPYANTPVMDMEEAIMEAIKKSIKPKGMGMGNASKFKYDKKPNMSGGFNTKRKEAFGKGTKAMGTGKAKFEYKEGESKEGWDKVTLGGNKGDKSKTNPGKKDYVKKMETKEASRTLGAGRYWGKPGLPKPKAAPAHLRKESIDREVGMLREKNEEYKKALDVFRNKLNEVAIFNSNLAYATRLFTEHSTTKQEKINILRRFDSVETIKESKNLYKMIKDELGSESKGSENTIKESFERTVSKTPSTGSSANLIESKTYENPQFLRMKDLMSKLK